MTNKPSPHAQPASELAVFIAAIDDALPQTQCTRCGYPDCRHYAEAIAHGQAAINQCPPGGLEGVARLSALTGQPVLPLNPANGQEAPRVLARIDEQWCIGCTLCIKACPTDAIVGANKRMHTIIAQACTGCELCLPVCPVDCIELDNASGDATGWAAWSPAQAMEARERYQKQLNRQPVSRRYSTQKADHTAPSGQTQAGPVSSQDTAGASTVPAQHEAGDKKAAIAAILAKARQQRAGGL